MPKLTLTDSQIWTLLNCLRVAAEKFEENAKTLAAAESIPKHARDRLVAQFEGQAKEARDAYALIEDGAL